MHLFDAETDMNEIVSLLKQAHHLDEHTAYKIEQIEDKDWEREWMDNFHPMQFVNVYGFAQVGVKCRIKMR